MELKTVSSKITNELFERMNNVISEMNNPSFRSQWKDGLWSGDPQITVSNFLKSAIEQKVRDSEKALTGRQLKIEIPLNELSLTEAEHLLLAIENMAHYIDSLRHLDVPKELMNITVYSEADEVRKHIEVLKAKSVNG
jgi:hypothetical protein